ncbi:Asp23/Gls24 family envelope stress response protein [Planomonospora sp. ID91781]|uniref:Stress protein, Gls24 family n=1 Tax=Planomonospora sphaerica TaxID=161355 RepID=A0A171BX03_9ACTN|nr:MULTISPECIES: Asp23/Gls24 family envelope stress response protein [Planomonospora]MBG0824045.1 Asp23/Gls24 family envelope stress response protein [Planomonospora sp. ID91781]GAT65710.1 stress protein, Gls24 family [Planomonospora sphaerica]
MTTDVSAAESVEDTVEAAGTAEGIEDIASPAETTAVTPAIAVADPVAPAVRPFSLGLSVASAPEPVSAAVVKGRIKVADEVVEKVAALATLEVTGVADLGEDAGHLAQAHRERSGARRAGRGVGAHVQDRTVAVDVAIVAEYGHVVMDVANEVKTNVARTVSRMLGMRVVEVNVTVDDVRLPGEPGSGGTGDGVPDADA